MEARAGGARPAASPDSLGFRLLCLFLDFLAAALLFTIVVVRLLRSFPEHEIVRAINKADLFPLLLLLPGFLFALAWALVHPFPRLLQHARTAVAQLRASRLCGFFVDLCRSTRFLIAFCDSGVVLAALLAMEMIVDSRFFRGYQYCVDAVMLAIADKSTDTWFGGAIQDEFS